MTEQHLTAVFALRPSKRKAVLLERARAQAEAVYWQVLGKNEGQVKAIAQVEDAKDRRKQLMNLKKPISRAVNEKLHEPIAAGLNRDVMAANDGDGPAAIYGIPALAISSTSNNDRLA